MAYCDVTYASTYLADSLFADAWNDSDSAKKTKALAYSTRLIKQYASFVQDDAPFVYDETTDVIPSWLKDATCEEAQYVLTLARDPAFDKKLTLGIVSTDGTTFSKEFTPDILCLACRTIIENNGGVVSTDAVGGKKVAVKIGIVSK